MQHTFCDLCVGEALWYLQYGRAAGRARQREGGSDSCRINFLPARPSAPPRPLLPRVPTSMTATESPAMTSPRSACRLYFGPHVSTGMRG